MNVNFGTIPVGGTLKGEVNFTDSLGNLDTLTGSPAFSLYAAGSATAIKSVTLSQVTGHPNRYGFSVIDTSGAGSYVIAATAGSVTSGLSIVDGVIANFTVGGVPLPRQGRTFFVDASAGNDSNNGQTYATALATIYQAYNVMAGQSAEYLYYGWFNPSTQQILAEDSIHDFHGGGVFGTIGSAATGVNGSTDSTGLVFTLGALASGSDAAITAIWSDHASPCLTVVSGTGAILGTYLINTSSGLPTSVTLFRSAGASATGISWTISHPGVVLVNDNAHVRNGFFYENTAGGAAPICFSGTQGWIDECQILAHSPSESAINTIAPPAYNGNTPTLFLNRCQISGTIDGNIVVYLVNCQHTYATTPGTATIIQATETEAAAALAAFWNAALAGSASSGSPAALLKGAVTMLTACYDTESEAFYVDPAPDPMIALLASTYASGLTLTGLGDPATCQMIPSSADENGNATLSPAPGTVLPPGVSSLAMAYLYGTGWVVTSINNTTDPATVWTWTSSTLLGSYTPVSPATGTLVVSGQPVSPADALNAYEPATEAQAAEILEESTAAAAGVAALSAAAVTITSPVKQNLDIEVVPGRDYTAADGVSFTWKNTGGTWAGGNLAGATVTFAAKAARSTVNLFTKACTVLSATGTQVIQLELPSATSALFQDPGSAYTYEILIVNSAGARDPQTVRGNVKVLSTLFPV